MQASHSFYLDGEDTVLTLVYALEKAVKELEFKTGLTLTVTDVTIERNPHGAGIWQYLLKINTH